MRGSKSVLGVIPLLVHGIQKTVKSTNNFSILSWIPLQADDNWKTDPHNNALRGA
ncbi:MAG: hypothetical protein ACRYE8_06805 [Janthinobacterium lividum]